MRGTISNNVFWLLLLSATFMACKIRKTATLAPSTKTSSLSVKKNENIELLRSKDIVYNTLSVKAKAKLDIAGSKNNATMNFRIEKGRRIWVSITVLGGMEVARALITPDSIKVRNNFQNVYLKKPFSYLHKFTSNQVKFEWLESILSGNTVPDFLNDQTEFEQTNGYWLLKGKNEALAYSVFFDNLMKVTETNINNLGQAQSLKVVYSGGYHDFEGSLFPNGMAINSMTGAKIVNIELEYSGAQRNLPLEFPFTVPGKYEVIN